ncbi:hypothetical protein [Rheinheimera gaetbuli]
MTDTIQLLQQVATQLKQEGKSPSLALFRARLAGRITPQQLFAAYQHWRNHPLYAAAATDETETQSELMPTAVQPDDLQQQLNRIEAKLDALLSMQAKS